MLHPDDVLDAGRAADDLFERIDRLAATSPAGSRGVIFTPWLNGERTPVDDHTIRGGWHNLSLRTDARRSRPLGARGRGLQLRWLLDTVESFTGRPFPGSTSSAVAASRPVWAQIHADVLDRPIRRVDHPIRANARGAALLAGITLGEVRVDELDDLVPVVEVHEPDPANPGTYDELYGASERSTATTRASTAGSTGSSADRRRRRGAARDRAPRPPAGRAPFEKRFTWPDP